MGPEVFALDRDTVVVDFGERLRSLGTTVYGGGLGWARAAVFRRVGRGFRCDDPWGFALSIAREAGYEDSLVFLTAVDVREMVRAFEGGGELGLWVFSTIGLEHPSCLGGAAVGGGGEAGTINILAIATAGLSDSGLADLFRAVSEAKASYLSSAGFSCGPCPAAGTVSDATAVASRPGSGAYAGFATALGVLVARAIPRIFQAHMTRRGGEDLLRIFLGKRLLEDLARAFSAPEALLLAHLAGSLERILRAVPSLRGGGSEKVEGILSSLLAKILETANPRCWREGLGIPAIDRAVEMVCRDGED